MNNRKKICICLIIISSCFIVASLLLYSDKTKKNNEDYLYKDVTGVVDDLYLSDITYSKVGIYYIFTAKLNRKESKIYDLNEYSVYFLDNENNLIYLLDGSKLGQFSDAFDYIDINFSINYDLTNLKDVEIVKKEYGFKINKDLRNKVKNSNVNEW